ncbi:hypothetical protein EDD85DRAFT_791973 [Armillaria nabsnona]|nr:hypothetical protein EDD85DRAFT_791973 [Armillaria nabsnona]
MHPRTDFRFLSSIWIWQVLVGQQTNTAGEEHTPFIKNPRPTAGYEYQREVVGSWESWSSSAVQIHCMNLVNTVERPAGEKPSFSGPAESTTPSRNSSLPVLVLCFSELVEVFAEILKLVATYHDLHRKDRFPCGVFGTNQRSSVMSCGFHELVFLLLFRRFSLPSLLSSALHRLGKVSANGLHLPEVGACILDSKRAWNPQEVNNENL